MGHTVKGAKVYFVLHRGNIFMRDAKPGELFGLGSLCLCHIHTLMHMDAHTVHEKSSSMALSSFTESDWGFVPIASFII